MNPVLLGFDARIRRLLLCLVVLDSTHLLDQFLVRIVRLDSIVLSQIEVQSNVHLAIHPFQGNRIAQSARLGMLVQMQRIHLLPYLVFREHLVQERKQLVQHALHPSHVPLPIGVHLSLVGTAHTALDLNQVAQFALQGSLVRISMDRGSLHV